MTDRAQRRGRRQTVMAVVGLLCGFSPVLVGQRTPEPQRHHSSADERERVAITVYNGNFGLVREVRNIPLSLGRIALEFQDVAAEIEPQTVHVAALGDPSTLRVLEQDYRYDLLSPEKLLEKYVGRRVRVYRYNAATGRDEEHEAEVLAVNGGPILRVGDEITYNFPGRFAFPEIPDNLIAKPTLVWLIDNRLTRQRIEVSYLTRNLNWRTDYVLVLSEDDARGELTGWVTLTNQSGTSYENAYLKLVAGDVQRVSDRLERRDLAALRAAAEEGRQFQEEGFFEYHLYTLERPTTVLHNEQKQVVLLQAPDIGVQKRFIYYGAAAYFRSPYGEVVSNQKVGVYLDVQNSADNNLGMPLPAGIVRVYKVDGSGAQQFVGEDRIDHTSRDERVRVRMGDAFDVVGERRQMEYRVLGSCAAESAWEIAVRNHKDEPVEVQVVEPIGGDWEIVSSSHEVERVDARTFRFTVRVPANGTAEISYRVRVRWC